jgi:tripartite ATP-independent transporter DctM subunit
MKMAVSIAAISLFIFISINVPIAIGLAASTLLYFIISNQLPIMIVAQRMIGAVESVPLLAIPFFVTLGTLMNYSGISKRVMNFAEILTGHMIGGLAQVNVLLSTLMGGLSASNLADAAMQSKILVPEMVRFGYSKEFSAAVTAASSLITPIIPPGIGLIVYGFIANVSIGKMFMAGIIPGILMCVAQMMAVHVVSKKRGYRPTREKRASLREVFVAFKDAAWALTLVIVIIGGVRAGVFTPTEAGAVAVAYTVIIGAFVYRDLKAKDIYKAIVEAVQSTGSIMLIIMAASAFAWVLTWEGVTHNITNLVVGITPNPYVFLLVINIFLLILGMLVEGSSAMIILIPLLLPTVKALGIDLIHFGIILILNLAIGTLTPPMGTILFVTSSLTGAKIDLMVRELVPFYIVLLISLFLVTYVPAISLFLPNLLFR